MLRHLWSIGAELDAEDATGKTPLHYAVAGGAKEAVEFLVATAKVWPGAPDGSGDDTPMHLAARSGDVELAKVLIKAVEGGGGGGSSSSSSELIRDKNKRGLTPLGEALLLPVSMRAAAATAAAGKKTTSAVSFSSSSSKISKEEVFAMADALFEASGGESSSLQAENSGPRGWPLLHVLAAAGSAEGVEWLLLHLNKKTKGESDCSSPSSSFVNERSSEATGALTPLHAAAIGGSARVAELLLAAAADVAAADGDGRTAAEAFEAAFAAATKAAAAAVAATANAASSPTAPPPLPLATAEEAKKLRSLLASSSSSSVPAPSSAAAKKKTGATLLSYSSSAATTSSASVEAFSNDSSSNSDSFSFSFESPAATFKALPLAERLAAARRWSQLDGDDALEAATSQYSPAAFEQARLARGMRHAKAIALAVQALHDDEDFQEAAKLRRVREAVAAVRQDPSSIPRFQEDPKAMDVLLGLRKLQAVCAANGRHAVPFEELVIESAERASKRQEDEDRVAGLGRLVDDHVRAAAAAAAEDDPKEAAAAAERALAEARGGGGATTGGGGGEGAGATAAAKKKPEPTGLLARARAVLAAASAEAEAAEAAAARGEEAEGQVSGGSSNSQQQQPFDWSAFWRSLTKAMAASLLRAAIAFVVLWMVMKATTPPPATVVVPPPTATEAEL